MRPGSVINLVERVDAAPELIEVIEKIDPKKIIFMNHSDCLMYKGQPQQKPFDDLREAVGLFKEEFSGIDFTAMWAEIAPGAVHISEVEFPSRGSFSLSLPKSIPRSR
ncbi:MAG: hypothetical protein PHH21_02360 [Candidatus Pacebacteria bacterium]|nr:hypothetical protein [Candidatus Paceibacterota bacterium]